MTANCIAMRVIKSTHKQTQFSLTLSIQKLDSLSAKMKRQRGIAKSTYAEISNFKTTKRKSPISKLCKVESHTCGGSTTAGTALSSNAMFLCIGMVADMMASLMMYHI